MRVSRSFNAKARVKPKSKKTRKNVTRPKRKCYLAGNHVSICDLDNINKALHANLVPFMNPHDRTLTVLHLKSTIACLLGLHKWNKKSQQGEERMWKLIPKDSKEVYKLRRKRAQQDRASREENIIDEEPTEASRKGNPSQKQINMEKKIKLTKKKPSKSAGEGFKKKRAPLTPRCYSEGCSSISSMLSFASCHDCDSVTTASTDCSHCTDMEY